MLPLPLQSTVCPICGLTYTPETDQREHARFHKRYEAAIAIHGSLRNVYDIERDKHEAWRDLAAAPTPEGGARAFEKVVRCYFERSLRGADFSEHHPTFEVYARAIDLGIKEKDALAVFREKYPLVPSPFLPKGYSHWRSA